MLSTTSKAAVHNDTAVSQTYESVHLTEAARQAKNGEGNLEDLLHWAIENSDPEQLKHQAEIIGTENVGLTDRQKEVQQVQLFETPTSADMSSVCSHAYGSMCRQCTAGDQRYARCPN